MSRVNNNYRLRDCNGGEDYSTVIGSVDAWWGGRRVSPMLPRLFFQNFSDTTFMAVMDEPDGQEIIVGFLCGFVSPSRAGEAHAHFIGIDPAHRGSGLGAALYDRFFRVVKARDVAVVHAVTSPFNSASVAFHKALGFNLLRVTCSAKVGDVEAGARDSTPTPEMDGDGVRSKEGSLDHGHASDDCLDSEFVHIDYDGPDGGDRVLMEKRL